MRIRQIKDIHTDTIAEAIKEARLAIAKLPEPDNKTMEDICKEVGVSKTYWYDIEYDRLRGSLSIENLRKIEAALKVDLGINFNEI